MAKSAWDKLNQLSEEHFTADSEEDFSYIDEAKEQISEAENDLEEVQAELMDYFEKFESKSIEDIKNVLDFAAEKIQEIRNNIY